jgi:hypothetical protein
MRDTSRDAYKALFEQLPAKRGAVLRAVLEAPETSLCDAQIAARLGWPINCVTGRRNELEQMGYLESAGHFPAPITGQEVHYWQICEGALEPGFVPAALRKATTRRREPISVHEAAQVLVAHRRRLRQTRATAMPLFEGVR